MPPRKRIPVATPADQVAYRINTLLHTMRAIQRHEDALCTLMTEIKNSGAVNQELDQELRDTLEQMPAHEYADDIEAVRQSLEQALTPA